MPKISVLMPIYKTKEDWLREAIESILTQTYSDFEFLILDDYPEDSREEIVKTYKDERIKYFKNERNLGISASRNKLIDLAKGEYLAIFDHDDISLPTRLEKEVNYLDEHPEIGVVSCNIEMLPKSKICKRPEFNQEIKKQLMLSCIVAHTGAMLRKSVLDKYNIRYEEIYSPAEDYKLFLTLVKYTMFYNIQEVLLKYRSIDENTSHKQKDKMFNGDALCRCFAAQEYPYLYSQIILPLGCKKVWMKFLGIPLLKLRVRPAGTKGYLFGVLPILELRG